MSWIKKGKEYEGSLEKNNAIGRKKYMFGRVTSYVFLVISILVLLYLYYLSEVVYVDSEKVSTYFKYKIFFLFFLFFWAIVLRLKDSTKLNIAIVSISLVVGIYIVEIGLYFFKPYTLVDLTNMKNTRISVAKERGLTFDERTKNQVYLDMKQDGIDVTFAVFPGLFTESDGILNENIYPLGGVANKATIVTNESGKYMIVNSDRYGFNNPDKEWDSTILEWLITGDSFGYGEAVQKGEEISGQIRSLTKDNVISIGMMGNGPLIELASLKEYAEPNKPKNVIWLYYEGNDLISNLPEERKSILLMSYLKQDFSQNLMQRRKEIKFHLEKYILEKNEQKREKNEQKRSVIQTILWNTRFLRLFNIRGILMLDDVVSEPDIDFLFGKILLKAKKRISSWGGKIYFVYLPDWSRYGSKIKDHNLYKKRGEVLSIVKQHGIPIIDIHNEVFLELSDPLSLFPLGLPGHYNSKGYNEIAKKIVLMVNNDYE